MDGNVRYSDTASTIATTNNEYSIANSRSRSTTSTPNNNNERQNNDRGR